MAIETTSTLSNARWAKYIPDYIRGAMFGRVYDHYSSPVGRDMSNLKRGSSVVVNFLQDMPLGTETISEVSDVTPTVLGDATQSISPTSRWGLLQVSERMLNEASTNYAAERFYTVGKNAAESIDLLAQAQATQGSQVSRSSARASLDAGTAADLLTADKIAYAEADLQTLKVPSFVDAGRPMWVATMHPYAFADLRADTRIVATGEYQKANIILKHELGELGPFKLQVTPWAKTFWSAGADNASSVATTVSTAVSALDKTFVVAANTNMAVGGWLSVGSEETADTHYETNERVRIVGISGTTITIAGEGANGGFRFDHAASVAVRNADSVGTVVFGGPMSMAKLYDTSVGEFGQVVGPKKGGALDQFDSLGWKFYGDYKRMIESWLLREEVAFGREA
jgi:N4-gp56 family major capsid protein